MKFELKFISTRGLPEGAFALRKAGDTLVINGESFDFSQLPDGGMLPSSAVDCDHVSGEIRRSGDTVQITLIAPYFGDSQGVPKALPMTVAADGEIEVQYEQH